MTKPYFSILVPTFNSVELARRAINSCLSQIFTDFELIIGDDSATYDVQRFILSISDSRVSYFKNTPALGAVSNWNQLLSLSRGQYIKLLHHDDFFSSSYSLTILYEHIISCSKSEVVFNSYVNMTESGITIPISIEPDKAKRIFRYPDLLLRANLFGSPSNLTVAAGHAIQYDSSLSWFVDVDYYISIISDSKASFLAAPITSCLSDGATQISRALEHDPELQLREYLYLIKKYRLRFAARLRIYIHIVLFLLPYPPWKQISRSRALFALFTPKQSFLLLLLYPLAVIRGSAKAVYSFSRAVFTS